MKKSGIKATSRLKSLNPVFHRRNKNEDEAIVSQVLLKQARKSGKLNLSNKYLCSVPPEIFKLGDAHSADNEVDLDNNGKDGEMWWEMEPLTYLDLSSNCIKDIPGQINQLDSLTVLNLHGNSLESVPVELGHLFRLTKLNMSHNKLADLPNELSGLKELSSLNLSYNELKTIPECVFDLVMLNNLDLSHNKICQMKPGIGFLTRLTHLDICHNQLESVTPDISNLRALVNLDLSFNVLTTEGLPHLGDLHSLQLLHLQNNQLTLLPKIDGCSALKEIHLGANKMEILIPEDQEVEVTIEELSTLSHLQVIDLRENKIKKLPKEMSCLQNLIRMDLSNNDLKELPATLGLLPHLQNLLVEGNSLRAIRRDIIAGGTQRLLKHLKQTMPLTEEDKNMIAKLPCHFNNEFPDRFSMRSSKSLNLSSQDLCTVPEKVFEEAVEVPCNMVDLSKNKLKEIPQGVWSLSSYMTDLNVSSNQISTVPADVGGCSNLTYLNLRGNQLTDLPVELSCCRRLREIHLSFNRFQEIPSCLFQLKELEILLLDDNKVSQLNAEGLLQLKNLATLDLNNNNISNVPPLLGKMIQLRSLKLDGNGLRAPRPAILAKGTEAILSWLRDKIES